VVLYSPRVPKPGRAAKLKLTLGVDEAGRGPAIGPMVLAVVALDSRAAASLTRSGLRDSKSFGAGDEAHATREALADKIRERARFIAVETADHELIDTRVSRNELNVLEREIATRLISAALDVVPALDRIIADGKRMFAPLALRYPMFESRDRAEDHHASVAAASVIAKVERDRAFHAIRARYSGEFGEIRGGGYANAATRRFVRAYVERYRTLPPECRRTWPHPYVHDLIGDTRPPGIQTELAL
jgi:ribonuclease HII